MTATETHERPDQVKISETEARQILAQRLKRLEGVGIADAAAQERAAQTLWPRLFARAGAGALDPC
jgi:plasmid stability protein